MKKQVTKFINNFGCQANYQGKTKTMFINHIDSNKAEECELKVLEHFKMSLPFKLASNVNE